MIVLFTDADLNIAHDCYKVVCLSVRLSGVLVRMAGAQDWVVQQINALQPSGPYYYWTSLTDTQMEGDWHWGYPDVDDPNTVRNLV